MYDILQTEDCVEFRTRLSRGVRVVFALLALAPLATPYEFLIKPSWQGPGLASAFACAISVGAIAISALLTTASLKGLNKIVKIDFKAKTVTYIAESVIQKRSEAIYPFDQIKGVNIVAHDWTDGPSTYELAFTTVHGVKFDCGAFDSRTTAEKLRETLGSHIFAARQ